MTKATKSTAVVAKSTKQVPAKRVVRKAKHAAPSEENIAWVEGTGALVGKTAKLGKDTVAQVPVVAKSFWSGLVKGFNS